jgi:hypothetical protein
MALETIISLVLSFISDNKKNPKILIGTSVFIACIFVGLGFVVKPKPSKLKYCEDIVERRNFFEGKSNALTTENNGLKEEIKRLKKANLTSERELIDKKDKECEEKIRQDRIGNNRFDVAFECAICIQEGYCQ